MKSEIFTHTISKLRGKELPQEPSVLQLYPDIKDLADQGLLKGKHLSIILDGNGRWATEHGFPVEEGHRMGAEAAKKIMRMCADLQMDVSMWILSPNNMEKRSRQEINAIYGIIRGNMKPLLDEAQKRNGRIVHVGDAKGLPLGVKYDLWRVQRKTRNNSGSKVGLAINYSEKEQVKRIAKAANKQKRGTDYDKEGVIEGMMYGNGQMKEADMVVRTGKVQRLSGFGLPFVGDGSELFFPDVFLPDFSHKHLHDILIEYFQRNKTLGGRPDTKPTTLHISPNGKTPSNTE